MASSVSNVAASAAGRVAGMGAHVSGLDDEVWSTSPEVALRRLVEVLRSCEAAANRVSEFGNLMLWTPPSLDVSSVPLLGWMVSKVPQPVSDFAYQTTRRAAGYLPTFAIRMVSFALPGFASDVTGVPVSGPAVAGTEGGDAREEGGAEAVGGRERSDSRDRIGRLEAWLLQALQAAAEAERTHRLSASSDASAFAAADSGNNGGAASPGDAASATRLVRVGQTFRVMFLVINKALRSLHHVRGQSPSAVLSSLIRSLADTAAGRRGSLTLKDLLSPGTFEPYEPVQRWGTGVADGAAAAGLRPITVPTGILMDYREMAVPLPVATHRRIRRMMHRKVALHGFQATVFVPAAAFDRSNADGGGRGRRGNGQRALRDRLDGEETGAPARARARGWGGRNARGGDRDRQGEGRGAQADAAGAAGGSFDADMDGEFESDDSGSGGEMEYEDDVEAHMCSPQSFPPTPDARRALLSDVAMFTDNVVFRARDELRSAPVRDHQRQRRTRERERRSAWQRSRANSSKGSLSSYPSEDEAALEERRQIAALFEARLDVSVRERAHSRGAGGGAGGAGSAGQAGTGGAGTAGALATARASAMATATALDTYDSSHYPNLTRAALASAAVGPRMSPPRHGGAGPAVAVGVPGGGAVPAGGGRAVPAFRFTFDAEERHGEADGAGDVMVSDEPPPSSPLSLRSDATERARMRTTTPRTAGDSDGMSTAGSTATTPTGSHTATGSLCTADFDGPTPMANALARLATFNGDDSDPSARLLCGNHAVVWVHGAPGGHCSARATLPVPRCKPHAGAPRMCAYFEVEVSAFSRPKRKSSRSAAATSAAAAAATATEAASRVSSAPGGGPSDDVAPSVAEEAAAAAAQVAALAAVATSARDVHRDGPRGPVSGTGGRGAADDGGEGDGDGSDDGALDSRGGSPSPSPSPPPARSPASSPEASPAASPTSMGGAGGGHYSVRSKRSRAPAASPVAGAAAARAQQAAPLPDVGLCVGVSTRRMPPSAAVGRDIEGDGHASRGRSAPQRASARRVRALARAGGGGSGGDVDGGSWSIGGEDAYEDGDRSGSGDGDGDGSTSSSYGSGASTAAEVDTGCSTGLYSAGVIAHGGQWHPLAYSAYGGHDAKHGVKAAAAAPAFSYGQTVSVIVKWSHGSVDEGDEEDDEMAEVARFVAAASGHGARRDEDAGTGAHTGARRQRSSVGGTAPPMPPPDIAHVSFFVDGRFVGTAPPLEVPPGVDLYPTVTLTSGSTQAMGMFTASDINFARRSHKSALQHRVMEAHADDVLCAPCGGFVSMAP